VHPAIATAGSTMSRASARPNDRPAILIAAPSSGGAGECRAAHKKSPTSVTPYGFFHDCRCTVPPLRLQPRKGPKVASHPDNIAAAVQRFWDGIANLAPLD
jgi:hypothetical protein